jgi:epoxyqueuosine reductase
MVAVFQHKMTTNDIKEKARALGCDLVGIADGAVMNAHPPSARDTRKPSDISDFDADRVIVLAKRIFSGTSRMPRWDERHKYYNDELILTRLEEASLELVLWLETQGYPALIIPPTHNDPWRYFGEPADPDQHKTLLSLRHAAVEAGLGTLGLNQMLLTPEFGPRVILTAVLTSAPVETDQIRQDSLCTGPSCGRCVQSCPGDVIGHWDRDWAACNTYRAPHGFESLVAHVERIIDEPDTAKKKKMLRSKDQFYLWQSILRGAGVVTGCRRCQDVCPVGADYAAIADALESIPEATPEKQARLDAMRESERAGIMPQSYQDARRWIGSVRD